MSQLSFIFFSIFAHISKVVLRLFYLFFIKNEKYTTNAGEMCRQNIVSSKFQVLSKFKKLFSLDNCCNTQQKKFPGERS